MSGPARGGITYIMWRGMLRRCYDPECKDYDYYGGRGITVHAAWKDSFAVFADELTAEIGDRPDGAQMDRIDNARGYEPGNIRWATSKHNNNNRRDNKLITFRGKTMTAAQWADEMDIPRQQVANRLNRGWSVEQALTEPVPEKEHILEIGGEALSITEWARRSGRKRTTITNRLRKMSPQEAVFGELTQRFDKICPRCKERPRTEKDHYCSTCRNAYMADRAKKKRLALEA